MSATPAAVAPLRVGFAGTPEFAREALAALDRAVIEGSEAEEKLERAAEDDLQARFGPDFLAAYRQQGEALRQHEPADGGVARSEP